MTLMDLWARSPAGRQALAAEQAMALKERASRAKRRDELRAEFEKRLLEHDVVLAKANAGADAAAARYEATKDAVRRASLDRRHFVNSQEASIATIEGELRATADPAIDEAISEVHARHARLQATQPARVDYEVDNWPAPGRGVATNAASIAAAMSGCRDAIRGLEELKLAATDDLPGAIDAIVRAIPDVEEPVVPKGAR